MSKKLSFKAKNLPIFKKKKGTFPAKKQAVAELKNKKRTFLGKHCEKNWVIRPKIYQFSKKKKKRDISGQKNKLGLSLRTKKRTFLGKKSSFKAKNLPIFKKKKKGTFRAKTNKLGLSLRRRKKLAEKLNFKAIIKKKTFPAKKNKLGLSLIRKNGFLGQKLGKFLRIRSKN